MRGGIYLFYYIFIIVYGGSSVFPALYTSSSPLHVRSALVASPCRLLLVGFCIGRCCGDDGCGTPCSDDRVSADGVTTATGTQGQGGAIFSILHNRYGCGPPSPDDPAESPSEPLQSRPTRYYVSECVRVNSAVHAAQVSVRCCRVGTRQEAWSPCVITKLVSDLLIK